MASFQKPVPRLAPETAARDELLVSAGLKGVTGTETQCYSKYKSLFSRAGGVHDAAGGGILEEPLFCAWVAQHYGLDGVASAAVFQAFDQDRSGRLNRHEFSLLLRTIDHYSNKNPHPNLPLVLQELWQGLQRIGIVLNPVSSVTRVVLDPLAVVAQPTGMAACSAMPGPAAMVAGMTVDPELMTRSGDDWRGAIAAPRGTAENIIGKRIVKNAQRMADDVRRATDESDAKWLRGGAALRQLLGTTAGEGEEQQQAEQIKLLAADVARICAAQPSVARVPSPCKVFGDIHGQFRDLLMLFASNGFPSHYDGGHIETCAYVFNGDFVDRGHHQMEVVVLLFALKSMYPARVFLNRGNHEIRAQNLGMTAAGSNGFDNNCKVRFPSRHDVVFERIHVAFDWLPFASVVSGKVLVLHGGIGDGSWGIRDLEAVERPVQDENAAHLNCVKQAMWSDPRDSDDTMRRGVHRTPGRGDCPDFTADETEAFCRREGVALIIRSHQYMPDGYKFFHRGHLITVFSARNYCDSIKNDMAIIVLKVDELGQLQVAGHRHLRRAALGGGGGGA